MTGVQTCALPISFGDYDNGNLKYVDSSGNVGGTGIGDAYNVGGVADFDGDGDKDIAFRDANNNLEYVDNSGNVVDTGSDTNDVGGVADFDGDGDDGGLYMGNVDPPSSHSNLGYNGPNPDTRSTGNRPNSARLELENGNYVWDLSGNVREWTSTRIYTHDGTHESPQQNGDAGDESWHELDEITD